MRLLWILAVAKLMVEFPKIYKFLIGVKLRDGRFLKVGVVLIFEEVVGEEDGRLVAAVAVVDEVVAVLVFSIVLLKHLYAFLKV